MRDDSDTPEGRAALDALADAALPEDAPGAWVRRAIAAMREHADDGRDAA